MDMTYQGFLSMWSLESHMFWCKRKPIREVLTQRLNEALKEGYQERKQMWKGRQAEDN